MISAVGSALSAMIGWIGNIVTSLVAAPDPQTGTGAGALYALLPLFAIGIAASLCMFAMKIVDSQSHLGLLSP